MPACPDPDERGGGVDASALQDILSLSYEVDIDVGVPFAINGV